MVVYNIFVYHHCLFGTRYDFLCANYTAFDQTLFNCNFASNVDCQNSKKFWHRNDELYKEKSTTTSAPVVYNFYTPPPQAGSLTPSPEASGRPLALPPAESAVPRRPAAQRPRPYVRGRPQYDYYEDDYEELPRPKGRKRRPRPRPVYYDDYEDYEDERFVRRGSGRRRPYNRRDRPMRRNKDRRKYDYDDVDYRDDYDDVVLGKKQKDKRRKVLDDYEYEDERRERYEKRRPQNRRNDKPSRKAIDDDYDYEENERHTRRKTKDESRAADKRVTIPRLGKRRPPSEDYEDDLQRADNPRAERTRKSNKESSYVKPAEDGRPMIKPVSGTIYDRPRVAPRINLPVPKNAAGKFAYKPIGAQTTPIPKVEEYEDYEEPSIKQGNDDKNVDSSDSQSSNLKLKDEVYSASPSRSHTRPKLDVNKGQPSSTTPSSNNEKSAVSEEYEDDYEDSPSISTKSTTTTPEPIIGHPMPVIRKFKRPFLPSRGGSPSRNLQPVGAKAQSKNETENTDSEELEVKPDLRQAPIRVKSPLQLDPVGVSPVTNAAKEEQKPGPIRIKVPIRVVPPLTDQDSRPQDQNRQGYKTVDSATPEQAKLTETDILNGNYDITLNEAISPIIPKLPVRGFGSFSPANDYAYKRIQRPTKYVILDPVVSDGYYVR